MKKTTKPIVEKKPIWIDKIRKKKVNNNNNNNKRYQATLSFKTH